MKPILLSTAIILGLVAQSASASDQLARSIGVEPGVCSTSELIQIRTAMEENDNLRVKTIKEEARAPEVTRRGGTDNASRQLEMSLGVEPGSLSQTDLVRLKKAMADDD